MSLDRVLNAKSVAVVGASRTERHVVALAGPIAETRTEGAAHTASLRPVEPFHVQLAQELGGAVGGAVVHDEQIEVTVSPAEVGHHSPKARSLVVGWNERQNAEPRRHLEADLADMLCSGRSGRRTRRRKAHGRTAATQAMSRAK